MNRYIATFTPQAWVNDYAIEVELEGEAEWDVTEFLASLTPEAREDALVSDSYESDVLRDLENAPAWVKDWSGPFYITVEESEDD